MKAKNTLIGLGVIAIIVILVKAYGKKEVEETNNFSGKDNDSKKEEVAPSPPPTEKVQKWVYSIEDGKEYCRWYDGYGRNTVTYNNKCSKTQANMYGNKSFKKR